MLGALNNVVMMWHLLMYYLYMYSLNMSPPHNSGNQYHEFVELELQGTPAPATVETSPTDVGDQLLRTFPQFISPPIILEGALEAGWMPYQQTCNPILGFPYYMWPDPISLLFTAAGQIAGFGVRILGNVSTQLIEAGYLIPVQGKPSAYDIFVVTRSSEFLCSGSNAPETIGDRLLINGRFPIELTAAAATANGWMSGMCMPQMGIHYSTDINKPGQNTWNAATLNPVIPLYSAQTGHIDGLLINTWNWQDSSMEPYGVWEQGITTPQFCMNWCANSGCHFNGVQQWNTLHWYFTNPTQISCTGAPCQAGPYQVQYLPVIDHV